MDYLKQAEDFLWRFGVEFSYKLCKKNPVPFPNESTKACHYHFKARLKRMSRSISFNFYGSKFDFEKENKAMSAYDLLASITKYDPGTFEYFCEAYGYNNDNIRSKKIYNAVCAEWEKVNGFFTDYELERLREIV